MRADHSGTHILEERTALPHRTKGKESVLLEEIGKENFPNNFFQPCDAPDSKENPFGLLDAFTF